jgi:release factor glutamine methyltransferase
MEPSRSHPQVWTPKALLDWSATYFTGKGIAAARLDAERLLAHVLGCTRLDLYLQFDRPLIESELAAFRELVRRRAEREPVPYLTGEAGFWKLALAIRPGCLIPRPDTEALVEAVIAAVREQQAATSGAIPVLEYGTGSAAIPLAVCSDTNGLSWLALERSAEALDVARENRARHAAMLSERGHRLHLVRGDGFAAVAPQFRPRLFVSNPPYVASGAIAALEPEVARYEPFAALDGGPDGLDAYRVLLPFAAERLAPGGDALFEIGFDQAEPVTALAQAQPGLSLREVRRDLEGRPRVVWVRRGA